MSVRQVDQFWPILVGAAGVEWSFKRPVMGLNAKQARVRVQADSSASMWIGL
jgi:hypothetical protein